LVGATLTFHPFNTSLVCADGSPYGIYSEDNPKIALGESQNHILVLMGGGACANPEDCRKDYRERPYVFSTSLNPSTIEGDTVLSRDASINPSMHSYAKWLIPYCSQDLFLGDINKGQVGDFRHMGAAMFREAFAYWRDQVLQARRLEDEDVNNTNDQRRRHRPLDNVVVLGISAGAIGLMNHIPTVRAVVNQVGATNLKVILDAPSVISDHQYVGKDFNDAINYYVDVEDEFPLCSPTHPLSGLYDSVSQLPCCLSTHCLIRHDTDGLASFVLGQDHHSMTTNNNRTADSTAEETLLVLDSAYDPVNLLGGTSFLQPYDSFGTEPQTAEADGAWHMMESAGGQKVRAKETAAFVKASLALQQQQQQQQQKTSSQSGFPHKRLHWVMTSCLIHTFLAPAVEFIHLACKYANYGMDEWDMVCNPYGVATQYTSTDLNLVIRLWRTIHVWDQVRFEGQSIHDILDGFVTETSPSSLMVLEDGQAIDLQLEGCSGPNCLGPKDRGVLLQPSCQSLIEIEDSYKPIPPAFQVTWLIFMAILVISSLAIRTRAVPSMVEHGGPSEQGTILDKKVVTDEGPDYHLLSLSGIYVRTKGKQKRTLLHDVEIELQGGTITGLVGRSGSGKVCVTFG
jgi:ABC-type multidrug transport system fused ATPase/permease subunit